MSEREKEVKLLLDTIFFYLVHVTIEFCAGLPFFFSLVVILYEKNPDDDVVELS